MLDPCAVPVPNSLWSIWCQSQCAQQNTFKEVCIQMVLPRAFSGQQVARQAAVQAGAHILVQLQIVARVKVGALPVHGYNVPQLGEFWLHSDIDGTFYVISVDNVNASAAKVAVSGHFALALPPLCT